MKSRICIFLFSILIFAIMLNSSCKKEEEKHLPTLITSDVIDITQITATCGGTITSDGGSIVTVRGICWNTSSNPTITDNKTINSAIDDVFTCSADGLCPGITYYVRAYATNAIGTAYGNENSFTTNPITLPVLTTLSISSINSTSVHSGGNITSDGGATITSRGVCWSLSENPTINDSKTVDGNGVGVFISTISDLNPNTTYYFRAYATNSSGTAYATQDKFTTISNIGIIYGNGVTDVDNNVYISVIIGDQEWMGENLRTTKYNNGASIQLLTDGGIWGCNGIPAYCWYNNDISNKTIYGALYNWYPVNTGNLCPIGWHVPTEDEWSILINYVGGTTIAGKNLKAINGWNTNGNGIDILDFSALPGGERDYYGVFNNVGLKGYWWTSTEHSGGSAYFRFFDNDGDGVGWGFQGRYEGLSVRCIKN